MTEATGVAPLYNAAGWAITGRARETALRA